MKEIKKSVLSLNVLGPMGDDKQEFEVGTNDDKTVLVQIGTVLLKDDGTGVLYLNGDEMYTSETINKIAADVLSAAKEYTNETVETITSFEIVIVDELPEVGERGIFILYRNIPIAVAIAVASSLDIMNGFILTATGKK